MDSDSPFFHEIPENCGESFWDCLSLNDILNLSTCSRASAGMIVPPATLNRLIAQDPNMAKIGKMKLVFPHPLSTGMVRRIFTRLNACEEAVIVVDDRNGRIVLDIGSAFHDNNAYLAEAAYGEDEQALQENQEIFKQLEIS